MTRGYTLVKMIEGECPWVTYMKNQVYKRNNCINLVVTSPPGGGKSYALLSAFSQLDPDFDVNEQCFFKAHKLIRAFKEFDILKGKPFLFDEAGVDASNLSWQDEINKGLSLFFQTARHRNYIFGMTVPFMSMVSKGVRTLMNCHWKAHGYTKNNFTKITPLVMEYNGDIDKFYRKRLLVYKNNKTVFCNNILLKKPDKNLLKEYEKIKKEFTGDLFGEIANRIEMKEQSKKGMLLNLTAGQERVLNALLEGKLAPDIAKEQGYDVPNVNRIMASLRNKGIKIQSDLDKKGKLI